jgi:hypothetical protein
MHTFLPPTLGKRFLARLLSGAMLSDMPPLPPPPPPPPTSPPPTPPQRDRTREFYIGLGVGAIPLLLAMIGLGGLIAQLRGATASNIFSGLLLAGGLLYLIALIVMIVFLAIQRLRRVGLGMVAALAASPVVFFISCVALLSAPRQ